MNPLFFFLPSSFLSHFFPLYQQTKQFFFSMKHSENFSLTSCQSKVDKMDGREIEAAQLLKVAASKLL